MIALSLGVHCDDRHARGRPGTAPFNATRLSPPSLSPVPMPKDSAPGANRDAPPSQTAEKGFKRRRELHSLFSLPPPPPTFTLILL